MTHRILQRRVSPQQTRRQRATAAPAAAQAPMLAESAAVKEKLERLEKELHRTTILNWDCWQTRDVKVLAGNVRVVSELAHLAVQGLRSTLDEGNTLSNDDAEWTIVDELLSMATLGSFVLARELEAFPEVEKPKGGV